MAKKILIVEDDKFLRELITKKLKDENSSEELRQKNTKEAYEKGIELGYWK